MNHKFEKEKGDILAQDKKSRTNEVKRLEKEKEEIIAKNGKLKAELVKKDSDYRKLLEETTVKVKTLQEELAAEKSEFAGLDKRNVEIEKAKATLKAKEDLFHKTEKLNTKLKENNLNLKKE